MFDCTSAQFLAIEEALDERNRRIVLPSLAPGDTEYELFDVVLELFVAAEFIVTGGARIQSTKTSSHKDNTHSLCNLTDNSASLMLMAVNSTKSNISIFIHACLLIF